MIASDSASPPPASCRSRSATAADRWFRLRRTACPAPRPRTRAALRSSVAPRRAAWRPTRFRAGCPPPSALPSRLWPPRRRRRLRPQSAIYPRLAAGSPRPGPPSCPRPRAAWCAGPWRLLGSHRAASLRSARPSRRAMAHPAANHWRPAPRQSDATPCRRRPMRRP